MRVLEDRAGGVFPVPVGGGDETAAVLEFEFKLGAHHRLVAHGDTVAGGIGIEPAVAQDQPERVGAFPQERGEIMHGVKDLLLERRDPGLQFAVAHLGSVDPQLEKSGGRHVGAGPAGGACEHHLAAQKWAGGEFFKIR